MKSKLLPFALLGLLLGAAAQDDAAKKIQAKLQGTWTTTSLQHDGKDFSDKIMLRFVVKGDQMIVEGNDAVKKEYAKLSFKLDPSTTPPIMDLKVADGTQKDMAFEGIYELKDDQLKICVKVIGNERPTEFAAPGGSSIALLILKRAQP